MAMDAHAVARALDTDRSPEILETAKSILEKEPRQPLAHNILKRLVEIQGRDKLGPWVDSWVGNGKEVHSLRRALSLMPTDHVVKSARKFLRKDIQNPWSGELVLFLLRDHADDEAAALAKKWFREFGYSKSCGYAVCRLLLERDPDFASPGALKGYSENEDCDKILSSLIKVLPSDQVKESALKYLLNFPGALSSAFLLRDLIDGKLLPEPEKQIDFWIESGGKSDGRSDILVEVVCSYLKHIGSTDYILELLRKYAGNRTPKSVWAIRNLVLADKSEQTANWLYQLLERCPDHKNIPYVIEVLAWKGDPKLIPHALSFLRRCQDEDARLTIVAAMLENDIVDEEILSVADAHIAECGFERAAFGIRDNIARHRKEKYLPLIKDKLEDSSSSLFVRLNYAIEYLTLSGERLESALKVLTEWRDYYPRLVHDELGSPAPRNHARYLAYMLDFEPADSVWQDAEKWLQEFEDKDPEHAFDVRKAMNRATSRK